jgi:hypothetical protein
MAVYDQSKAAANKQSVQREAAADKQDKKRSAEADLVPEENKVQMKKSASAKQGAEATDSKKAEAPATEGKEAAAAKGGDTKKSPEEAAKEKKAKEERAAEVTAKWEESLGKAIGAPLAKLVLQHVSLESLNGYVQAGLNAAAPGVGAILKSTVDGADKEAKAVETFSKGLSGVVTGQVDAWIKSESGQKVLKAISDWVQDNPAWVMTIVGSAAILGGIIAYVANPSVDLSVPFGLGNGWEAKVGLDMGKLRELAFKGASAELSYKSANIALKGSAKTENKDGKNTTTLGAEVKGAVGAGTTMEANSTVAIAEDKTTVKLGGKMNTEVVGKNVEVGGNYSTDGEIKGSIKVGEKGNSREISGTKKGDEITFSTKQIFEGGSVEQVTKSDAKTGKDSQQTNASVDLGKGQSLKMSGGTEGSSIAYQGKDVGVKGLDVKAGAGQGADGATNVNAGVKYDDGTLSANLDYTMKQGKSSLNLGASAKSEDGYQIGGSLKLDNGMMTELALKMGYQSPDQFKTFLLGYKQTWVKENSEYAHHFDALLEYSLGRWYGRVQGGLDITGGRVSKTNLDLGLGYGLNKDWKVIGGMQMNGALDQKTNQFDMGYKPYVGLQYKNVGVGVYYDTQNKSGGAMLTIPLGR